MRHAGKCQSHFDAGKRAEQRQVVEVAEVTDAEHATGELRQSSAERHVEALEYQLAKRIGVMPIGHQHGCQRIAVFGWIRAQDLQTPCAHGRTRRIAVSRVACKYIGQTLLEQLIERRIESVQEVRRWR